MKRSTILAAMAVVAAGVAGVFAAQLSTTRQTTSSAQPAVEGAASAQGLMAFVDENGNLASPTDAQLKAAAKSATKANNGVVSQFVPVDPNNPNGLKRLTNPPKNYAAARINAEGKLEALCLPDQTTATTFLAGAAPSANGEVAK